DAELEQLLAEGGSAIRVDRSRAAGENQAAGPSFLYLFDRRVVREELTEDTALADSPGYQLAVLPAEIQDQDFLSRSPAGGAAGGPIRGQRRCPQDGRPRGVRTRGPRGWSRPCVGLSGRCPAV